MDGDAKRAYQREWVAKRRAKWFSDKVCVRCGRRDTLQLDHIDPAQKVSHKIWSWSWLRIESEVQKCQVLCTPCHRQKTARDLYHRHGTLSMYRNQRCRCGLCKLANTNDSRNKRNALLV